MDKLTEYWDEDNKPLNLLTVGDLVHTDRTVYWSSMLKNYGT